jgi:aminopeptidase 2
MCRGHAEVEGGGTLAQGRELLPAHVKPLHYDLVLEPDFEKFTFEGSVDIE